MIHETRRSRGIRGLRPIGFYTGKMMLLLAALMVIPLVTSLIAGEYATVMDFLTGIGITAAVAFGLMLVCRGGDGDITWTQGMVVVALVWMGSMMLAAIPYYVSGYWNSYLDCMFDVMSGLTTTGLTLVLNLDHLPDGLNMWRHLLTWIGGQGIVVLALTFAIRSFPGAYKMYVGEGKDERLLPNVVSTAKAIWYVSIVYLVVGTIALGINAIIIGMQPVRAFLHGMWVFMAAWSTGGFAPQWQNIVYYHSMSFELLTLVFFIIGSFNFNLHWAVWTGNRRELWKNLETVTFAITSTALAGLAMFELSRMGVYSTAVGLFRRVYYSVLSAHTTTGFFSTYARQFALEWGPLAMIAITVAMLFGGSASSTAGGFKAVRIGIAFKAIVQDVRRLLAPERAVVVEKVHMGHDFSLEDRYVRTALTIIFLYVITWFLASMAGAMYGYDMPSAMYEAASAVGNVGLSAGISVPTMPDFLKVVYILAMWVGRLEFMAVFVLLGKIIRRLKPNTRLPRLGRSVQ